MQVSIKTPQYIRYPTEYHTVISFINNRLKNHDKSESKEITMAETLYIKLSCRNLITDGKILGIKINVVTDEKYLKDMIIKNNIKKRSGLNSL